MNSRHISAEVSMIASGQAKKYVSLYSVSGYEMGFGLSGSYESHSHLFFVDLLFSPRGIRWNASSGPAEAQLLVVPPRTQVPSVEINDFFFLKFCSDSWEPKIPDKIDQALFEGTLSSYSGSVTLIFPWYAQPQSVERTITVELISGDLNISFLGDDTIVIQE